MGATRTVLTLAGLVVVIAGLRAAGGFFLPLLAAMFIAVVSAPFLTWLEKVRVPRGLAIVLTILLDVAVLAGLIALVATSLSGLSEALPRYERAIGELIQTTVASLRARGLEISEADVRGLGDPAAVLKVITELLRELSSIVSNALLVVLLVAFMLFELASGRKKLAILLGAPRGKVGKLAQAAAKVQRYLIVKTLLSITTGLLFGLGLWLLGVDFPILWGLLAFLFNYIPSIGPALATVPPVIIALLTLGPGPALAATGGCLVVNVAVGNVAEPRLMGEALGLSTLVVFTSMLFWGWLWGPVGALLAVPLTMLLRNALETSEETQWIASAQNGAYVSYRPE